MIKHGLKLLPILTGLCLGGCAGLSTQHHAFHDSALPKEDVVAIQVDATIKLLKVDETPVSTSSELYNHYNGRFWKEDFAVISQYIDVAPGVHTVTFQRAYNEDRYELRSRTETIFVEKDKYYSMWFDGGGFKFEATAQRGEDGKWWAL